MQVVTSIPSSTPVAAATPRWGVVAPTGRPIPPPVTKTDAKRISDSIALAARALERFAQAKDALAVSGFAAAAEQLAGTQSAIDGMVSNITTLAPEHDLPKLRVRLFDAFVQVDDLRTETARGERLDEFTARCDAQVAELAAISALLRDVHFPS